MSVALPNVDAGITEDQIKAQRDARRRKILENSKARLEKITGRMNNSRINGEVNEPIGICPDPEIESLEDIPFRRNNFTNHSPLNSLLAQMRSNEFSSFGSGQQDNILQSIILPNIFSTPNTNENSAVNRPRANVQLGRFLQTKVHLALLSLLTYVLFTNGSESVVSYSIFLPLLLWELIEYLILKPHQGSTSNYFSIVLIISGIDSDYWDRIEKTIQILNKIFKDMSVFIFFFAITHVCSMSFRRFDDFEVTLNDEL